MNGAASARSSRSASPGHRDSDQPPSGFTAVNGHSPSSRPGGRGSKLTKESELGRGKAPPSPSASSSRYDDRDPDRYSSEASHKRKRSMPDPLSPSSSSSHRRKASLQQSADPSKPSPVSANGQLPPPSYARREAGTSPNGSSDRRWRRSSVDGSNHEAQQLADALGRDNDEGTSPSDSPDAGSSNLSPEFQSASSQQLPGQTQQHVTVPMHVAPSMGQPFQKGSRKRNFANRTKTGCMTCRKRKKKCDEAKPKCQNCQRGGFDCKGYSQSGNFLKSAMTRDQAPIQAKGGHGYDSHPGYQGYPPPPSFVPAPSHYPPIPADPHAYTRPPSNRDPTRPPTHDQPYPRLPGWHEHRYGPPLAPPPPSHYPPHDQMQPPPPVLSHSYTKSPRDIKSYPTPSSMSSVESRSSSYRDRDGPQSLARTANSALLQTETEKHKMLNHKPFDPSDLTLKNDRHQCKIAVYRFNSGCENPDLLSDGEKKQRFKTIIEGKTEYDKVPEVGDFQSGSVGDNVEVEAPFRCDYGYNIKIGSNTTIGPHCYIMDACSVRIGSNCMIGPNVSFYSQDGDHYPAIQRLNGVRRLAKAEPIIIEDDVFIGGHAILLPGAKIGKGATIGANTTVTRTREVIPNYVVVRDAPVRTLTARWETGGPRLSSSRHAPPPVYDHLRHPTA